MDENAPNPNTGNAPSRPTHRRVASNATPQERLAAMLHGVGAEQPAARKTFNPGAVEFRPAHLGSNGVGPTTSRPPVGPYNPSFPSALPSVPHGLAPTTAAHVPAPQRFPAAPGYPSSGIYSMPVYNQGNAGMFGLGGPGYFQGYAGGVGVMGGGKGNGNGNFGPPSRPAQPAEGAATQSFGPNHGSAQPSQGVVAQHGVIRGGRPSTLQTGSVQKLSYECQARKFNPEFIVTVHENMYMCNILLKGRLIQSSKRFDDPQDAKVHTATKALREVKQWPLPGPVSWSLADKLKMPLSDLTNQPTRDHQRSEDVKEEEHKENFQHMGTPGPSAASGVDMTDPNQARAFVEGYRMGQVADSRGSSTEAQADDIKQIVKQPNSSRRRSTRSARSRSPRRDHRSYRGHRSRSPPRYFDGSRHDPKLPSTDKYRPTPALAYRNADKPKKEDSYGRLKEEDYAE